MEEPRPVFYLLELDLSNPESSTKRYLYGGVAGKDCKPRLARLRNAHDWQSAVIHASEQRLHGRRSRSHIEAGCVRMPMDVDRYLYGNLVQDRNSVY